MLAVPNEGAGNGVCVPNIAGAPGVPAGVVDAAKGLLNDVLEVGFDGVVKAVPCVKENLGAPFGTGNVDPAVLVAIALFAETPAPGCVGALNIDVLVFCAFATGMLKVGAGPLIPDAC